MQLLSSTNDHLTNQVKKAYFYNRHEKIAAFLLEQKKKTISYTHEEIASLTGLNRVTVTKILNDFYQKGWIDLGLIFDQCTCIFKVIKEIFCYFHIFSTFFLNCSICYILW